MNERKPDKTTHSALYGPLTAFVLSAALLLFLLPVGTRLAPLRYTVLERVFGVFGSGARDAYAFVLLVLADVVFLSLLRLINGVLKKKWQFTLRPGQVLPGLVPCLVGVHLLALGGLAGGGVSALFALGLICFGVWRIRCGVEEAKKLTLLSREGETVMAKIVSVSRSPIMINEHYTYTVLCQADGRSFVGKTTEPVDKSCVGKKVPVLVSRYHPSQYHVELDRIVWQEETSAAELQPLRWRWEESEPEAQAPEKREEET